MQFEPANTESNYNKAIFWYENHCRMIQKRFNVSTLIGMAGANFRGARGDWKLEDTMLVS